MPDDEGSKKPSTEPDPSATPPPAVNAKIDDKKDARLAGDAPPTSPWPSARRSDAPGKAKSTPPGSVSADARPSAAGASWGVPLVKFDAAWTKLEARLCVAVLAAEIFCLVLWISL